MSFFSGLGKGLRKVGNVVGRGLQIAAPVAGLIPGVGILGGLAAGAVGSGLRKVTAAKPRPAAPVTATPANANVPFVTDAGARAPRGPGVTALPQQGAPAINASVARAPRTYQPGTSAIDPGNGLRGSRIDPTILSRGADRTSGAQDYRAAIGDTSIEGGAAVLPTSSARSVAAAARVDGAADALATGPDRVAMAKQALADFNTQLDEQRTEGIKGIGQSAAALGRVGSGMVTGKLADLERRVQSDRSIETNRLVNDLTERDASDRFNKVNAFAGLEERSTANDRATANELRGERSYRDSIAEGNVLRRMSAGDNAYRAGNERADVNAGDALRTRSQLLEERGYEDQLAGDAYNRELTLQELQAAQDREDFSRGATLDSIGYAQDPGALQFGVAGRRAGQAAETLAGGAALIGERARRRTAEEGTLLGRRPRTPRGTTITSDSRTLG